MYPLDIYAAAYLIAMGGCLFLSRKRLIAMRALGIVFAEWFACWCYYSSDLQWPDSIYLGLAHATVDLAAVYAFVSIRRPTTGIVIAEHCFKAALILHFLWSVNLAFGLDVARFHYLTAYTGLGYLAMTAIAGGEIAHDLSGSSWPPAGRLLLRLRADPRIRFDADQRKEAQAPSEKKGSG